MKKFFILILGLFVVVGIFAEGTAEEYRSNPYGTYNPNAIYPPYDIGNCGNMLGRALAAKLDLAQNGQDYSDASVHKALLLTGLTKKQAEITVKYCPKLIEFWNIDEMWKDRRLLDDPSSLYYLVLSAQERSYTTEANMIYSDMILELYE